MNDDFKFKEATISIAVDGDTISITMSRDYTDDEVPYIVMALSAAEIALNGHCSAGLRRDSKS